MRPFSFGRRCRRERARTNESSVDTSRSAGTTQGQRRQTIRDGIRSISRVSPCSWRVERRELRAAIVCPDDPFDFIDSREREDYNPYSPQLVANGASSLSIDISIGRVMVNVRVKILTVLFVTLPIGYLKIGNNV